MSDEKRPVKGRRALGAHEKFSPIFFEVGGGMGSVERIIHWFTSIIMVILSVVLIGGVLVSFIQVPGYFSAIIKGEPDALLKLLEFAAGLIIAIELVYVIIAQNLHSVIEILMIALTREIIIKYLEMWEILVGIVGIAVLFAIKKFLLDKRDEEPHVSD